MARRAEYKTPGGKLIAVEFDIIDDALHGVVVTGDFFLYPEEALPTLARSLEGAPATLTASTYEARIARALQGAELLGSSPEALANAVMRALHMNGEQGAGIGH